MKAVFDISRSTMYDDNVRHFYHIPRRYLRVAEQSIGDWIIYRETRQEGGNMCYVAVAFVTHIKPDPSNAKFSYVHVTNFIPFGTVVPLKSEGQYHEIRLQDADPAQIGSRLQGRSVRAISDAEFYDITLKGLAQMAKAARIPSEVSSEKQTRRIRQMLFSRPQRDAQFRTSVVKAYDEKCAVTGWHIINGGGRAEVQAAHIWSVQDGGPDTIQNGIALSATCHWLFDRHLISLNDDCGLLVSPKLLVSSNRIPSEMQNLFENQRKRIHLPLKEHDWPRRDFIKRHREKFNEHLQNLN